jgi:hypothetical protein
VGIVLIQSFENLFSSVLTYKGCLDLKDGSIIHLIFEISPAKTKSEAFLSEASAAVYTVKSIFAVFVVFRTCLIMSIRLY